MALRNDEVRRALRDREQAKISASRAKYSFYQMGMNSKCIVRFLPDADAENITAMAELHLMKFPFEGTVNSERDTDNRVLVQVVSQTTFGEKDAIQEDIKPLWAGSSEDKDLARVYYRKPQTLMSALVVSSPFIEKMPPDSPVRLLALTKQVYDQVKDTLENPDLEYAVWDFDHGRDFTINKTQQGSWAHYGTSSFGLKERPLSADERAGIEKYGLINLRTQLGAPYDAATRDMVWEMYQASLAGEPFDNARWGSQFRAFESQFDAPTPAAAKTKAEAPSAAAKAQAEATLAGLKVRASTAHAAAD